MYIAGIFEVTLVLLPVAAYIGYLWSASNREDEEPFESVSLSLGASRLVSDTFKGLAAENQWSHDTYTPEFGRVHGLDGELQLAITGMTSSLEGEKCVDVAVGFRASPSMPFLSKSESELRSDLVAQYPGAVLREGPLLDYQSSQTSKQKIPDELWSACPPALQKRSKGVYEVNRRDLILHWFVRATEGELTAQAVAYSRTIAAKVAKESEREALARLLSIYETPYASWLQLRALLLLLCYWRHKEECRKATDVWFLRWQKEWGTGRSIPFESADELDQQPLSLEKKRFMHQLALTYLHHSLPRESTAQSDMHVYVMRHFSWAGDVFAHASEEDTIPTKQLTPYFEAFCRLLQAKEIVRLLMSVELQGPHSSFNEEKRASFLWMRKRLWEQLVQRNERKLLIELLCQHCIAPSSACQEEGYERVCSLLSADEIKLWLQLVLEHAGPSSWFGCLDFLVAKGMPCTEWMYIQMMQKRNLTNGQYEGLLWAMEKDGGHESLALIHRFLEEGRFDASLLSTAREAYEAIKERLGHEMAGGLTLFEESEAGGDLSLAEDDEGKVSLGAADESEVL